jgi:Flp pilus assembly protein TadB
MNERQLDRVVERTAARISAAMDKMCRELPEGAAPQMALERVVDRLTQLEPWFLDLIMEDNNFRETYEAAVARRPARRPANASRPSA